MAYFSALGSSVSKNTGSEIIQLSEFTPLLKQPRYELISAPFGQGDQDQSEIYTSPGSSTPTTPPIPTIGQIWPLGFIS
jgi:hypothetical protein